MRTPKSSARVTTSSVNWCHSRSGSAPTSSSSSLPVDVGGGPQLDLGPRQAPQHPVDQVDDRPAGPVVEQVVGREAGDRDRVELRRPAPRPRRRRTGRRRSSPRARARGPARRGRVVRSARRAPCAPLVGGRGGRGRTSRVRRAAGSRRSPGRVGQYLDLAGEPLEPRRLAHDPALVAGVHALEDAGELPVAEGHVVVDRRRRRGPTRPRTARPARPGRGSPRAWWPPRAGPGARSPGSVQYTSSRPTSASGSPSVHSSQSSTAAIVPSGASRQLSSR